MKIKFNMSKQYNLIRDLVDEGDFNDRSEMLEYLNFLMESNSRYVCVNSMKDNGKSVIASLVTAYYSKNLDSRRVFDDLYISETDSYDKHLNNHNVIHLNCKLPRWKSRNYEVYICNIEEALLNELDKQFPSIGVNINYSLWQNFNRVYKKTGQKFIFVFDDWDFIMKSDRIDREDKQEYLDFLAELFTDAEYVEMAYLTGRKTISAFTNNKYLDMFTEFELTDENSKERESVGVY